jgi:hypothetical protein
MRAERERKQPVGITSNPAYFMAFSFQVRAGLIGWTIRGTNTEPTEGHFWSATVQDLSLRVAGSPLDEILRH